MSNIIHKFAEKVGGSLDDNDNENHQQTQGLAGKQGMQPMIQPRRFQTGEDVEGSSGVVYRYGQQESQIGYNQDKSNTVAGRGFKDDWKTAENMRLSGV